MVARAEDISRTSCSKFEAERWQTSHECNYCAEWRSTAIVRDDLILAHTDCKEMDLCPIRAFFRRKAFLFWYVCPKVKFALSSYFYWTKKSLVLCVGPLFWKNRSDRARRVVHSLSCCMFHASLCTIQSRKFCGDFHFLATGYLLCMEMTSSCLRLSSFYLGLDPIIT